MSNAARRRQLRRFNDAATIRAARWTTGRQTAADEARAMLEAATFGAILFAAIAAAFLGF